MEEELVAINLMSGLYYASPGVGARIWQLLEAGASLAQMTTGLTRAYDVPAAQVAADLAQFIALLAERDLIMDSQATIEDASVAAIIDGWATQTYAPPSLQAFDDMAQAFAIDPAIGVTRQ